MDLGLEKEMGRRRRSLGWGVEGLMKVWQDTYFAGDGAVLLQFGSQIDPLTSRAVQTLFQALSRDPVPGMTGAVPSYTTLLLEWDPRATTREAVLAAVEERASLQCSEAPKRWRIPVCYDKTYGIDLAPVAAATGLSADEVVGLHTGQDFLIYCLGFAPGFPYCGLLPPALRLPRRDAPRTRVEAGAVAIAGDQTGMYPMASPAGWHVLGRTPVRLFDPRRTPPVAYGPGDVLRFYPVSLKDFEALQGSWLTDEGV